MALRAEKRCMRRALREEAYLSDVVKAALILAVAAIVVAVLALGRERVWCEIRGGEWAEAPITRLELEPGIRGGDDPGIDPDDYDGSGILDSVETGETRHFCR